MTDTRRHPRRPGRPHAAGLRCRLTAEPWAEVRARWVVPAVDHSARGISATAERSVGALRRRRVNPVPPRRLVGGPSVHGVPGPPDTHRPHRERPADRHTHGSGIRPAQVAGRTAVHQPRPRLPVGDGHSRRDATGSAPMGKRGRRSLIPGSGTATAQRTENETSCQPVAPSGITSACCSVWVSPELSVARTVMVYRPSAVACHGKLHSRQVSPE